MAILNGVMVTLAVFLSHWLTARGLPDTRFVAYGCIGEDVEEGGEYAEAISIVVSGLIRNTGRNGNNYLAYKTIGKSTCYGQGICHGISSNDCMECLRVANMNLIQKCFQPLRGLMMLASCTLRYQEIIF